MKILKKILKKILSKDALYYIQGNLRSWLYYSKHLKGLIRPFIKEQIALRIEVMDRVCFNTGSCKLCGCKTTELQMCNKSCKGKCYPPMLNKIQWEHFKVFTNNTIHVYDITKNVDGIKNIIYKGLATQEGFISATTNSLSDKRVRYVVMKSIFIDYHEQS